jgi:hypothetical protein
MLPNDLIAVPDGDEESAECACCGRPLYSGGGTLENDAAVFAEYFYQWSEGHQGRFTLAIKPIDEDGESEAAVAVIDARLSEGNLVYGVLEPEDSPWDFGESRVMSRAEALEDFGASKLFELVDAVASKEDRLSSRVLSSRLSS